ncbi:MAG: UDP-N-acetylmuramoyl-L-alanine--D-glutamate ligase [Actinobacteria bacterium]|nr:UDP-N-acetylmuramoyl-L-alanine--D-glutamate ligase [Actinomycetota bacterium]
MRGERVLVVGAGVSGSAAARVFAEEGARVLVTDERPRDELPLAAELEELGIEVEGGGHEPSQLGSATLVFVSPGVAPHSPVVEWALARGLPVWGELELGARLSAVPYVAVTGTNGKTTTTGMVASCLRAAGIDAIACGNVGHPFPLAAREGHEALVVEASSFQLWFQESFHPKVSVLLNVAQDHVDWHGSVEGYTRAKARVHGAQGEGDLHVGNRDDEVAAAISREAPCPIVWFGLGEPSQGEVGYVGDELITRQAGLDAHLGPIDPERAGYRADAAAAAAASIAFGASAEATGMGLASFTPARHRGEVVAVAGGVRFVDNSKATNVHAALAALEGVRDAVLIAGGRAKGVDLSPLAAARDRLRAVVAIGESADDLVRIFEGLTTVRAAGSIEEAVRVGFELAAGVATVLLAPACASWDQFRDYAERGERFAAAARAMAEGVRASG